MHGRKATLPETAERSPAMYAKFVRYVVRVCSVCVCVRVCLWVGCAAARSLPHHAPRRRRPARAQSLREMLRSAPAAPPQP